MQDPFDSTPKKGKTHSYLKLVVSNPYPPAVPQEPPAPTPQLTTGFTAELRKRDHAHYTLVACDHFHYLNCEIALEVHNNEDDGEIEPQTVVCHFPAISGQALHDFVEEDDTLYGIILLHFQIKLLEQLLLFCKDHDALTLLILVDDTPEGHDLGGYRPLVTHEDKVPTLTGTKTQMVIPTTQKTFDKWITHMDQAKEYFRYILWQEKRTNPIIREYVKSDPCSKFFS